MSPRKTKRQDHKAMSFLRDEVARLTAECARLSAERGEVSHDCEQLLADLRAENVHIRAKHEALGRAVDFFAQIRNSTNLERIYGLAARAEIMASDGYGLPIIPAATEPKPCQCGSPILRWVHNQPPLECGKVYPAALRAPAPSPVSEAEKAVVTWVEMMPLDQMISASGDNLCQGELIELRKREAILSRLRGESAENGGSK